MKRPQKLPTRSRRFGKLYEWLNSLLDYVESTRVQIPHNVKMVRGPQGFIFEGGFGGRETTTSNDLPVWL